MSKYLINFTLLLSTLIYIEPITCNENAQNQTLIQHKKPVVWGPGLNSDIVLPIRYFFINVLESINGKRLTNDNPIVYKIEIKNPSDDCGYIVNQLHRNDGSLIVRYRLFDTCNNAKIHIQYEDIHIGDSPYTITGNMNLIEENCNCQRSIGEWLSSNECSTFEQQIYDDLKPFGSVNFTKIRDKLIQRHNLPNSVSLCNYIVRNNLIYRKCYGNHTGFKMFIDAILGSLVRKVKLPDLEFFINLGDWPLAKKGGQSRTTGPYPIFSWCGSEDSFDIVLPTYDITHSTLEGMVEVELDLLSVQRKIVPWKDKIDQAFWRGRDSRRERLQLIDIAREYPDLLNASLTNFFFFRNEEAKYGPKVEHISFMKFFNYKYQINVDGTVASYRLPYLLGGDSVVFKQKSPFYEHFYRKLIPFHHYIPFERDLSDLVQKIKWAQTHESEVLQIIENARKFVNENLLPKDIYCYHMLLFKKWSENLVDSVRIQPDMEIVPVRTKNCKCSDSSRMVKDEL